MNYIILNGTDSRSIKGLLIQSLPPITKPQMRIESETIDGRDGDIITELGYAAYDKEISIGLYGSYDIDKVIEFFNSKGTVTFSNESDKFYHYEIVEQIDFERLLRFRQAAVTFHVQPFKYPMKETPASFPSGINLLLDTDRNSLTKVTAPYDRYFSNKELESGINCSFVTLSDPPISGIKYAVQTVTSTATGANKLRYLTWYLNQPVPMINGETYTMSCYARLLDGKSQIRFQYGSVEYKKSDATFTPTSSWKRYSWTFTYDSSVAPSDSNGARIYMPAGGIDIGTLQTCGFKLEKGEVKETEYTPAPQETESNSTDVIVFNRGNIYAKPILTIFGQNNIEIILNGKKTFNVSLGSEEYITIDTERLEAYKGSALKNRIVNGDYDSFIINKGENTVTFKGTVTEAIIQKYTRWL